MRSILRPIIACIPALILLASMEAPAAEDVKALKAQWRQPLPDGATPPALKRTTDAYPLSDQENKGGWTRYEPMSDEFEGSRLDEAKWNPFNPFWKGRKPGCFLASNVKVSSGQLHLTMKQEDPPPKLKAEGFTSFTCANVQSKTTVRYGYFEVHARPMRSHGSSSFWFSHGDKGWWTEIDVFEICGGSSKFEKSLHITTHVHQTPADKTHWSIHSAWTAPFNLADAYHVYGLEWDERDIKVYFDGALVRQGPNTHWHQPLMLNFDSETMPEWFGLPRAEDLPSTYSIEYVRAWKKKDQK